MFKGIKGLLATLAIATGAWAQGNVWDGSADISWYDASQDEFTITTAEQLSGLRQLVNGNRNMSGKTITLGNDIMLNDTTNWQNWGTTAPENSWTPIGNNSYRFQGTFDGAGHIVSGVYINNTSGYQGLFGVVGSGGTIKNLGVVASYVKGNSSVGGLVGSNYDGTITNSYATGSVTGTSYVGGLVGNQGESSTSTSSIANSYATGNVTGTGTGGYVGGLVGSNYFSKITNSYAAGTVTGRSADVGGLTGYNSNSNSGTITNSYYDSQTSGRSDTRGTGLTTSEMKSQRFVKRLNIAIIVSNLSEANKWVYTAGNYPALSNEQSSETAADYFASGDGTQNNPYIIQTPEQLENFSNFVNLGKTFAGEYIKLGNNIMLNDTTNWQNWETAAPARTWMAIGTSTNSRYFQGTFDGAGHVVSGVYINRTGIAATDNYQGLFGYVGTGGAIENLGVVASYVKGNQYVGGLAGYNNGGTITNSYATGTVSGNSDVGGLAGQNNSGTITGSYATGTVSGTSYVGGLVGRNYGTITNSYAMGSVSGTDRVGGLAGYNNSGCTITNSYATGSVSGTSNVGGLVGYNNNSGNEIARSYYNRETSGRSDNTKGTPKTTAEMKTQATYVNWNFDDIWAIDENINDGYPYLLFPVSNILGVITSAVYNETKSLSGTAEPWNAYNKTIVWSVVGSGATINENDITFTQAGQVTIRATVENGLGNGSDYTQDFHIEVKAPVTVANGTGSDYYAAGATVTIIANDPPAGEQFKQWDITPSVTFTAGSATDPEAEFTMPAEAVTATAVYEPIPPTYHLITVHKEGSGIANPNVESATQGTQITLTATPDEGNRFVRWDVVSGGITLSSTTTPTATFTMPDNAVEVKAVFEEIPSPILLPQLASGNKAVQTRNGLSLTASSNATVEIYNLSGNLVSRQSFASGVYAISLGHLPKGLYLAKVSFGSGKEVLRVPVR